MYIKDLEKEITETLKESKEVTEKLNKLLGLYKSDSDNSDNNVPDYLPVTEDTPIGTIVNVWNNGGVKNKRFFSHTRIVHHYKDIDRHYAGIYLAAYSSIVEVDAFEFAEVDVKADLQFRAFLNAPKECKWFAIDSTGIGFVFVNKPILDDECLNWIDLVGNYALGVPVGNFDFYAKYYKKILVKRL